MVHKIVNNSLKLQRHKGFTETWCLLAFLVSLWFHRGCFKRFDKIALLGLKYPSHDLYCDDSSYDTAFSLNEKQVVIIGIETFKTHSKVQDCRLWIVDCSRIL